MTKTNSQSPPLALTGIENDTQHTKGRIGG